MGKSRTPSRGAHSTAACQLTQGKVEAAMSQTGGKKKAEDVEEEWRGDTLPRQAVGLGTTDKLLLSAQLGRWGLRRCKGFGVSIRLCCLGFDGLSTLPRGSAGRLHAG